MTIVYRHDDEVSGRWAGKNGRLTNQEGDENLFDHESRISTLEGNYALTVSLDTITQPTPSSLLFHKTDGSTQGPFDIPPTSFRDRGDWEAATPYLLNDTFLAPDGGLYRVLVDHTSAGSFSPTANDGAGHDYYAAMISPRGNTLPAGGAASMYIRKNSGTDYDYSPAYIQATEVNFSPSTGSTLPDGPVSDALEELEARIAGGPGSLAGLSDVNVTPGSGINGYFLQWNNATSKWVAAASSTNLSGLADVNVTEGSGINGYFLKWDNGTGKWVAAASSSSLAGLSDVNVTEGAGIDGYFLKWSNASGKWVASVTGATSSPLTGLSDVNITTGSGVDGYVIYWDNGAGKFQLKAAGGSTASTTEVLTGTDTAKSVTPDALAALWEKGSDVASATTVSLGEGGFFHVTGTTTITDIDWATAKDGRAAIVVFDGVLTLTHNATTLKLPGGANITTAAGDRAIFVQDASDNVICVGYFRASGQPLVPTTTGMPVSITIAASDESTALTSGTSKVTFRMPHAISSLTEVRASLTVVQTSGSIFTVDINEAGSTILSTKLTIDNTEKTSTTAATAAVISDTSLADDAEITIDIDQVGDGTAKGLKVTLIGTR